MTAIFSNKWRLVLFLGISLGNWQTAAATVNSNFETSAEGWQIVSFNNFTVDDYTILGTYAADYNVGGGNPGNYISTADPDDGDFTFSAPVSYLGDQSTATALSFDLIHPIGAIDWQTTDLMLVSGSTRLLWNNKPDTIPGNFWTHISVNFAPSSDWRIDSVNGAFAAAGDFQKVLANLGGIYIHGEFTAGRPELAGLDNVVLNSVPTPSAAWLFGSALAGLVFRRKQGKEPEPVC